jgi:hypothetical protein
MMPLVHALAIGVLLVASPAAADGEQSPMFGGAIVGVSAPEHDAELVGAALEVAWWRGRFGLAAEGSLRWDVEGEGPRATVLGVSARVRVLDRLMRSLLEPRDVELGIELHAVAERVWWGDADSTGYGGGIAIRLRGGSDDDFSMLLAESRLFVRVLASRASREEQIVRREMTVGDPERRGLTVLVGLGAAFGTGERRYLDRFRWHPFDAMQ